MRKNKHNPVAAKQSWTFQDGSQRFMTHMARIRLSTKAIAQRTGFSVCQITYGLHKYKVRAGMALSLRQRWANGTDPLIDELLHDRAIVEAMDAEIDNVVVPAIKDRGPKIKVKIKG